MQTDEQLERIRAAAPCGDRRRPRRCRLAAFAAPAAALAASAEQPGESRPATPTSIRALPERVPLTMSLRDGVPLYPGDPDFAWEVFTDTRTPQHDDGGYLLEHITSLGTHTASHISAPVHFILGGKRLSELDEAFHAHAAGSHRRPRPHRRRTGRTSSSPARPARVGASARTHPGRRLRASADRLRAAVLPGQGRRLAVRHDAGARLLRRGGRLAFAARSILATGSDTLGPDATMDATLRATTRTLLHGGITLENVGPQLPRMRPHGDWIAVNGNRPAFSGFQMGFTGFTIRN